MMKPVQPLRELVFPLSCGYYADTVRAQFPDNLYNQAGPYDVLDTTNGYVPLQVTGPMGALDLYYAFYWVANYGMSGHSYVIRHRYDPPGASTGVSVRL